MKRWSILILIKSLGRGGAEQLLLNASPYLDRSRFDYSVGYLGFHDDLRQALVDTGMSVTRLDGEEQISWPIRVRSFLREQLPDLVHAHSPALGAVARVLLPRSIPMVYTEHNLWNSYHPITYWANLLTYKRNAHVFSVSQQVRDSVRAPSWAHVLTPPPVEVLHHGLDPSFASHNSSPAATRARLGISLDALVIACVAGFKLQKGHPYLLRAFVEVRKAFPQTRLLLIGGGRLVEEMKDLARKLGLENSVLFLGSRSDVADLVEASDLFVLPSLHEGLPIALLEAMALGKPVVATRAGGIPEVVTSDSLGLLVEPADPKSLARAISSLLADADRRTELGVRARARAADFNITKAVARMEQVYQQVLQDSILGST